MTLPAGRAAGPRDARLFQTHAMFDPDGQIDGYGIGAVPAHSPYRAGSWVVMHGYPGYPPGPRRDGFRGMVLGYRGSTLLFGLTDDGREWDEHWGWLDPDGAPGRPGISAAIPICSRPQRQRYLQCAHSRAVNTR